MNQSIKVAALAMLICLSGGSAIGLAAHKSSQSDDPVETIRLHYAAINRQTKTYRRVRKELTGFSTEGGEMAAWFSGPALMKIVATYYGEAGDQLRNITTGEMSRFSFFAGSQDTTGRCRAR